MSMITSQWLETIAQVPIHLSETLAKTTRVKKSSKPKDTSQWSETPARQ